MDKLNRPFNNAKQTIKNTKDIESILSGGGAPSSSSKIIDDSASEPTKGINPIINDVKERKELIQKTTEGTKILAVSSDGTKQFTFEIDAKNDVADFDGLRVEGISSFNASKTTGDLQSDISILEDGSGVLIAREGDLEYYLTLNGANGFEIKKIENGSIVEYIPTDQQIVVGKNLSDLKIDVNGKVEGINGVITFDKDTIYEEGGLIKAKVGLTQEAAKLLFSNKVNYDNETGSKAILNATNGNEMEFKVGELAQPSLLLEQNGINMLNSQITKTVNSTADTHLVNKAEVKELIANAGIGDWKNIYDNGTLVPADDGEGNYYYVFNPAPSNLDQFTQFGEKDYVAVPSIDLYFSSELNKPFYDFSVVGDFSDLYGAGSKAIWLEDTLTITANEVEKFQNKEFIIYVKAKESGTNIIYNSKVLKLDFNYLMTFKNHYAELQLNEQINYQLEEYTSSTDTKPKISNGTWLTSDKDFRINKTDMLDVGSGEDTINSSKVNNNVSSNPNEGINPLLNDIATNTTDIAGNIDNIAINKSNIRANETAINKHTNDIMTNSRNITLNKSDITTKQNKLIAGNNITITGDTISANGGGSGEVWENIPFTVNLTQNLILPKEPSTSFSKIKIIGEVRLGSNNRCFINQEFEVDKIKYGFTVPLGTSQMSKWIGELTINKTLSISDPFQLIIKGYYYTDGSSLGTFTEAVSFKIEGVRK